MPAHWLASDWPRRLRRLLLASAAVVFAAATLSYTGPLDGRGAEIPAPAAAVELGFEADVMPHEQLIRSVQKDSPAKRTACCLAIASWPSMAPN